MPQTNRKARQYIRSITSKAQESSLDSQGRLQLPQYLIDIAEIEKECVIVGISDYFEIWSLAKWDAFDQEAADDFESDAEDLTEYLK